MSRLENIAATRGNQIGATAPVARPSLIGHGVCAFSCSLCKSAPAVFGLVNRCNGRRGICVTGRQGNGAADY